MKTQRHFVVEEYSDEVGLVREERERISDDKARVAAAAAMHGICVLGEDTVTEHVARTELDCRLHLYASASYLNCHRPMYTPPIVLSTRNAGGPSGHAPS